jgi:hypothetical protein
MAKEPWQLTHTTPRGDLTRAFLARLFWQASTPLLASLLLQACAHDGSEGARGSQLALQDGSLTCSEGRWRPMSGLALAEEVDFAALRYRVGGDHPTIDERDAAGVPCARASDARLCEAEMRRLSIIEATPEKSHFLIGQGDTVRAIEALEDKIKLLGRIDTPDEALLLLEHQGIPVGCTPEGAATRVVLRDDGYRVTTTRRTNCQPDTEYAVDVKPDGKVEIVSETMRPSGPCATPGRRPANLLARVLPGERGHALARYFARAARLEAASVAAFDQLAEELRMHGAPRALREAARRAAEDEVRHAHDTARLAERFGARPETPRLGRSKLRGLSEVALDNALEGCVAETYAAYVATAQARMVTDGELAAPLRRIAEDETAHAALSWNLAAYLEPRLDRQVARRIRELRAQAIARLGSRAA